MVTDDSTIFIGVNVGILFVFSSIAAAAHTDFYALAASVAS